MKFTLTFFVFLFFLQSFSQQDYHVAPFGNNANSGSLVAPWQTIEYGLSQLTSGSVLLVHTGIYNEKINIPVHNIVLRKYAGANVIIDATAINTQTAVLSIINKSNIVIDGFEIRNNIQNDAQGILVQGKGENITIQNCKLHDIHFSANPNELVSASTNAQGIIVYGTDASTPIRNLKIINNELYDCRIGFSEGIAVNGNIDGFEITNNNVHHLTNIGIDVIGNEKVCPNAVNDKARNGKLKGNKVHHCISPYAVSAGIYVDGGKDVVIENNSSYHNGYGIEIGCERKRKTTENIIVRNNVLYDNMRAGIALGGYDYPNGSGKVMHASVTNNTFLKNDISHSTKGEIYLSYSESSRIESNIFYMSAGNNLIFAELTQPNLRFDYNLFYNEYSTVNFNANWNGSGYTSFSDFVAGTGTNNFSIFADPQLLSVNLNSPDFHIPVDSPCVNGGNPSYSAGQNETDYYNNPRIQDGIVDIGANECNSTTSIQVVLYPNPIETGLKIETSESILSVELFDAEGSKKEINMENSVIDMSNFPSGNYFLHITTTSHKRIEQIFKK